MVATRHACEADEPALVDLYKASGGAVMTALGVDTAVLAPMQVDAQRRTYRARYPMLEIVVAVDGELVVGRLYLGVEHDGLVVADIVVDPARRGEGIGTTLLRQVLDRASAERKDVRLRTAAAGRARGLYERLGFVATSEAGDEVVMTAAVGRVS